MTLSAAYLKRLDRIKRYGLRLGRRLISCPSHEKKGKGKSKDSKIIISRHATEYQAEILVDQNGRKFTAPFPEGVDHKTQYGSDVKAHSVYMSQFQMVPYNLL